MCKLNKNNKSVPIAFLFQYTDLDNNSSLRYLAKSVNNSVIHKIHFGKTLLFYRKLSMTFV